MNGTVGRKLVETILVSDELNFNYEYGANLEFFYLEVMIKDVYVGKRMNIKKDARLRTVLIW